MNCAQCGQPLPSVALGEPNFARCPRCRTAAAVTREYELQAARPSLLAQFPFTSAIVAMNALVFAAMLASGVRIDQPTLEQLQKWGADYGPLTLGAEPWRLVTNMFVHAGTIHIGFNMWCFWNLGQLAERLLGKWSLLLIYLFSGIAGGLLSLFIFPVRVSVGASGAIFGVAGALIAALKLGKLPIPKQALSATLRSLIAFAGYNLFFGAISRHIDNSAHLGGFGLGLLAGALLSRHLISDPESQAQNRRVVFSILGVLLLIAFWLVRRVHGY